MNQVQNSVTLIGNLGKDPDYRTLENGQVCRFSLATSSSYKNKAGEKVTDTQWHNVVAFGKTAEIISQYASKGSKLAIQGKITYRKYTDKAGIDRYSTDIVVSDFVFLSKREEAPAVQAEPTTTGGDDEYPFWPRPLPARINSAGIKKKHKPGRE